MSRKTRTGRGLSDFKKKLRILVDMDQVLCDFESSFLEKYQQKYPNEQFIPLNDRSTFYIADQYEKLGKGVADKARSIWNAEGFFLALPPIEGAIEAVKEMSKMEDVDVFICTSPLTFYKYCLQEKFQWVEKHLGEDWINRLVITKDKTVVNGDVLIDDRPRIWGSCDPPSWKQVLFSTPYNRSIDLQGRKRLDSWTGGHWQEIVEDFKKRI